MELLKGLIEKAVVFEGEGAGGGAPAGADADGVTGAPAPVDTNGAEPPTGDPTPPEGGAEGEEPVSFQYGDKVLTEAELVAAIEASSRISEVEGALHAKNAEYNALAKIMETNRVALQGQEPQPPQAPAGMTGEQMRDMLMDNPDGFMNFLGNFISEAVTSGVSSQVGEMDSKRTAESHFLGKHEDFNNTMANPEFREYVASLPTDSQGNPIYNEANAFLEFKLAKANAMLEKAKEAGFQAGEAAARENHVAAGRIKLLRGGGATPPAAAEGSDVKNMSHGQVLNAATQFIKDKWANEGKL
jgi:hypothetical protein